MSTTTNARDGEAEMKAETSEMMRLVEQFPIKQPKRVVAREKWVVGWR